MILDGLDMDLCHVSLEEFSRFSFSHGELMFCICPQDIPKPIISSKIHKMADLYSFLISFNFSSSGCDLPLNYSGAIRLYLENKEAMDLIFALDDIFIPSNINHYINTHFF